jgi:hypothetical protein
MVAMSLSNVVFTKHICLCALLREMTIAGVLYGVEPRGKQIRFGGHHG